MRNNQLKKATAIFTLLIFLLTTGTALAGESRIFKDIDQSSAYAREAIIELAEKSIIHGSNGNFNPTRTINRSEMIAMIVRALEIDTENLPETATFTDVSEDHWSFKYVEAAYREGIVKGVSTDKFDKDSLATREQMAAMIVRALDVVEEESNLQLSMVMSLVDAEEVSTWAKKEVELALASGLMVGTGGNSFDPKGNAKREQMAVVIHRLVNDQENILQKIAETINSQKPQHSSLYNALVKNQNSYKGDMHTSFTFSARNLQTEEFITIIMDEVSKVNNSDIHSIGNTSILMDDYNTEESIETIYVDGVLYIMDSEDGVWFEIEEVPFDNSKINENFLLNFNDYNITNDGEVEIEEGTVTKYTLRLSFSDAISMLPGDLSGMFDIELEEEDINQYLGDIEYIYEIYVNQDEEVVKLVFSLDFDIEEEGQIVQSTILMIVEYKNIGVEYTITAPEDAILIIDDFDFDFYFDFSDDDLDNFDFDIKD